MSMTQTAFFFESNQMAFDLIESKLPKSDWIKVSDVATAFNLSVAAIYNWIEEGHITSFNSGTPDRASHMIFRQSVLFFAKQRLGIVETKKEE
ncbi:MAG: helix-turn-helix domain-containing protein [Lentisphaerota bacterium]